SDLGAAGSASHHTASLRRPAYPPASPAAPSRTRTTNPIVDRRVPAPPMNAPTRPALLFPGCHETRAILDSLMNIEHTGNRPRCARFRWLGVFLCFYDGGR